MIITPLSPRQSLALTKLAKGSLSSFLSVARFSSGRTQSEGATATNPRQGTSLSRLKRYFEPNSSNVHFTSLSESSQSSQQRTSEPPTCDDHGAARIVPVDTTGSHSSADNSGRSPPRAWNTTNAGQFSLSE